MNKKKGYMKIKEIHGNEISPVLPFPSHEKAKLVLFYNPSAAATRRGGPRSFIGSASRGARGKERSKRETGREREGDRGKRDGGILQDGWTGVATGVERLSTSVLKVCDSLQIDSLSSF